MHVEPAGDDGGTYEPVRSARQLIGLAVLASGSLFAGTMLTVVIPVLPNIAKEIAGPQANLALPTQMLIAMPMLGLVLGGLLSTVIFGRFAARTVFLGAVLLYGVIGMAGMIASTPVLIGSRLLIGMVSACIAAASTAMIGERVAPARRPRVLGFTMAGGSIGAIIAMLISGRVADISGWRSSFLIFPVFALIMFVLAISCSKPSPVRVAQTKPRPGGNRREIFALWPIFLFVIAVNLTAFTTNSQASFVLAGEGVTSSAGRAQVMSINQLMIVIAALSFPLVRSLVGARFMPALILLVMGTGLALLGVTEGMAHATLALGILGVGNGLLFPYQSSLLLQRASGAVRGQAAGLMVSSQFLADAINPIVLGPIILVLGLKHSIALIGMVALVGCAAAVVVGFRYLSNAEPVREGKLSHG
jgi:MFS family permease